MICFVLFVLVFVFSLCFIFMVCVFCFGLLLCALLSFVCNGRNLSDLGNLLGRVPREARPGRLLRGNPDWALTHVVAAYSKLYAIHWDDNTADTKMTNKADREYQERVRVGCASLCVSIDSASASFVFIHLDYIPIEVRHWYPSNLYQFAEIGTNWELRSINPPAPACQGHQLAAGLDLIAFLTLAVVLFSYQAMLSCL